MDKFVGKNAVVTGGAGGIGYAICQELMKNKIKKLAIIDLQDHDNVETQLKADYPDSTILFVKGSVATEKDVEKALNTVKESFGSLYVIVNAAGISNEKNAQLTMDINLAGVIHSCRIGMDMMSKVNGGEGGYIVNIASVTGLTPLLVTPVYSATKAAIISYSRGMSHDYYYNKHGVKYMAICPGGTRTRILQGGGESFNDPDLIPISNHIFSGMKLQEPSVVGECVIAAIKSDKNGSVWLSNENKNLELDVSLDGWKTM